MKLCGKSNIIQSVQTPNHAKFKTADTFSIVIYSFNKGDLKKKRPP